MKHRRLSAKMFWGVLGMVAFFAGCAGKLPEKTASEAVYRVEPSSRPIREALEQLNRSQCDEDCSAFQVMNRGEDALRWRLALVDNANETLDLQYYQWNGDAAGALLMERVIQAADRGVRVRIIIDDSNIVGSRKNAAVLNTHPLIEIRVFNPFVSEKRSPLARLGEMLGDFDRLNHRMHNKLLVADNTVAVVGGRNIGDEYFGLNEEFSFRDMDLISVGPIVDQVSDAFDLYWNSVWVLPPRALEKKDERKARALYSKIVEKIKATRHAHRDKLKAFDPQPGEREHLIAQFKKEAILGKARIIVDTPPVKEGQKANQVSSQVSDLLRHAEKEVFVSSPYLIPTAKGMEEIQSHIDAGLKIRILTNSLESNDVLFTHVGYEPYREPLVEAGVALYEVRADAASRKYYNTDPVKLENLALHAKVAIVDRRRVFVGTMNFDPRAMIENTEVGVIVESPALAEALLKVFERDLQPANSWRVHHDQDGFIQFTSDKGSTYMQPAQHFWQRVKAWLAPGPIIEDLL